MKKLTLVFAVLAIMAGSSAFANAENKISPTVKASFQKNFANAENVHWQVIDETYIADFQLYGKAVQAAYDEKGELVGISRKMQKADLPLNVSQSLITEYPDYLIADAVTEISYEGKTSYYVTVENARKILQLKCFPDGQAFVEKRIKK
jgi:hypothetical protein